jgi:acetate kinase
MQDKLGRETEDARAAEAIALFCYQVRNWIPWNRVREKRNSASAAVDITAASRVAFHIICTDEELMIARSVCRILGLGA